ncbi:NADH-quinone oxidoreductase subunit A [Vallicoccus soli]|uniref:NADH-quinone oxidoreductase subunit n=1 Tax=Vallicoccus soli TaxID=2339232 RepID=A0A3A3Z2C7_9ACTN|nr:NADH-quinone oxidoreductase subunit A [Vallicoccus soli]RJK97594.1 NADH-quinone oxidoreductase subunit A [Vallicoccus soli]
MGEYAGALGLLLVALAGVGGLYLVHRATALRPDAVEALPFLSGWEPEQHALSRFHVRWYPATLVFLAFDVEMLFMYPWAVVVAEVGASAVVEMFLFLGVLFVPVVWAWREGALRWV